ncbi:MATE family efflux transporter [Parvularcula dongshanensis]|uniref:Putative MATE family efflux protein n=1 Tax=Parvularcula dongshanensis TaxID=1173995 RepID=A0A840I356_9PROT|nr:MATE family efflux transporter [Parvularcula dongshanensis]MBB4658618.1 putative MATE family efflux protein [Parvularcula dongshanensis]
MSESLTDRRRERLLDGPVAPVLFSLSWPLTLGLFAVVAINVTDTFYVGRLGPDHLAAIGYCFPVIFGMSAIAIGMGNGATSVVARALGAEEMRRARILTSNTSIFVLLYSIALSALMYATSDWVFLNLIGAPAELIPLIHDYMNVWYGGLAFLILPIVLNGLVRAAGEAVVPSVLMVLAAVVNAALSPVLIFGLLGAPALGMAGAAWATVVARGFIAVLAVAYLFRQDLIEVSRDSLSKFIPCVRDVLTYGAPAFLAQLVGPLSGMILTRLLSEAGPDVVAGYAVGARVEALAIIPFYALQSGISPFVGQNVGATRFGRLREAEASVLLFSLVWGAFAGAMLWCFGGDVGNLFTDDPMIAAVTDRYLGFVGFGIWGAGLLIVSVGVFNPLGYPNLAMGLNVLRYIAIYVGLALLAALAVLPFWAGTTAIFLAAPISYVAAGVVSFALIHRLIEKPKRVVPVRTAATGPASSTAEPSPAP